MKLELPPLPYEKSALEPYISARTMEFHYEKHHRGYLEKLKKLIADTPVADKSLEEIIRTSQGNVFNSAAQVWNHTFYWSSMRPKGGGHPSGRLAQGLERAFGSYDGFAKKYAEAAIGEFGSGWGWLVLTKTGELKVISSDDADNPIRTGDTPLLTIDVWEHAYYLDYQNERDRYVKAYMEHLINWNFAESNYAAASERS